MHALSCVSYEEGGKQHLYSQFQSVLTQDLDLVGSDLFTLSALCYTYSSQERTHHFHHAAYRCEVYR